MTFLSNVNVFVDCPACEMFDEKTNFCNNFGMKVPDTYIHTGCGEGVERIPF